MNIKNYPIKRGHWFQDRTRKKYVVWHGTGGRTSHTSCCGREGRATSWVDQWRLHGDHIGAPYLVDRDGTIYKTFDDSGWCHHLGIPATDGLYDKSSVAIEFANELDLSLDGGRLHAFGFQTADTVYTGPFLMYDWRQSSYFAQLDEAQVDAGIELTLDICRRYDIDPVFYYPSTVYDFPRCFQVATIICHSNCRPDRMDLCLPEWVFEKIEAAGIPLRW